MVVAAALPWSVSLGILGLWLVLTQHTSGILASPSVAVPAGICALAAGQLVFLMCIADRVFPKAPAAMVRTVESGLGAILLGGTIVLSVVAAGGGLG